MKYQLTEEDIELIVKALEGMKESGYMYASDSARELAVKQRIEQIKEKLGVEE